MKYTFGHIASALRGTVLNQCHDDEITHLLTDSRQLIYPQSSVFFALNSARRDGHQFVEDLYKAGVRNFVLSNELPGKYPLANVLIVDDTLAALQQLAGWHRKKFEFPVIGITGSNGKTIVKEWLHQLLSPNFAIVRSPRSYNSQIGVALSVWHMDAHHNLGIFEAGISQPDEMSRLQKMICPQIGIFTNIGQAHSEGFLNLRSKANEKIKLFSASEVLIYCQDYPEINEAVANMVQQRRSHEKESFTPFSWSNRSEATLQVLKVERSEDKSTIGFRYSGELHTVSIPFTDAASIENAMHCICTMIWLKIDIDTIRERLQGLRPVAMRLELIKGMHQCSVINDSYSADINSLEIALDFLARQKQHGRRTVILTDMLESGLREKELYERVSKLLARAGVNRLIGVGTAVNRHSKLFDNLPAENRFYATTADLIRDLHAIHFNQEAILLKGARVYGLEQLIRHLEEKVHRTVLEIDLDALVHNVQVYQKMLKPGTRMMGMVKAFSYGSGSYEIASVLQFHKLDYLAVAYADEGIELRKGGIELPIMVMNADELAFESLVQYNLEPELFSLEQSGDFQRFLREQGVTEFPVHIEIETGMNRLGFSAGDIEPLLDILKAPEFHVRSVFTHLVASEDSAHDLFTRRQIERFQQAVTSLRATLSYPFLTHVSNSSGISRHPEIEADMVRLGIGMYGIDSSLQANAQLREVASLRTTIASIKSVSAGETIGYGRAGRVERDSKIATVRIGYADGYPRALGNGVGRMLIAGSPAPVIGNVCMDMTMLDVTGIPNVRADDPVIVFGPELSVQSLANWAQTIPYEILTGVSQRVKRVYYRQ